MNTMKNKIKYITYYDVINSSIKRNYSLSSVNKVNYIIDTLINIGYSVEIISASGVIEPKFRLFKGFCLKIEENKDLRLFFSFGGNKLIFKIFRKILSSLQIFYFLIKHTKRDEEIIVYHSLGYIFPIYFAKKIKKFKLILEVEEIYNDVKKSINLIIPEKRFLGIADKYIFPTILLDQTININNKPSIIIHGVYKYEALYNEKFNDNRIHVVYAGTFDPNKGGVAAAAAAAYLSNSYHIHIIGFGTDYQISLIKSYTNDVDHNGAAKLTYDGLLTGEEYKRFIQKCDIGLSTQNPNAKFNETSFPSKILSYISNGLSVISIRIKAVETSKIGHCIYYYDEQKPECIAHAIKDLDIKYYKEKSKDVLNDLDEIFKSELIKFLS